MLEHILKKRLMFMRICEEALRLWDCDPRNTPSQKCCHFGEPCWLLCLAVAFCVCRERLRIRLQRIAGHLITNLHRELFFVSGFPSLQCFTASRFRAVVATPLPQDWQSEHDQVAVTHETQTQRYKIAATVLAHAMIWNWCPQRSVSVSVSVSVNASVHVPAKTIFYSIYDVVRFGRSIGPVRQRNVSKHVGAGVMNACTIRYQPWTPPILDITWRRRRHRQQTFHDVKTTPSWCGWVWMWMCVWVYGCVEGKDGVACGNGNCDVRVM